MTDETAVESPRHSSWGGRVVWMLFVVLVVYPLSTGPVIKLMSELCGSYRPSQPVWQIVEAFYTPIIALSESCRPVEAFFEWYIFTLWSAPP